MRKLALLGAAAVGLAGWATATARTAEAPAAPALEYVFSLRVEVAPPVETGEVDGERRRFIPITGGSISGPRLTGAVLSGGGDWQVIQTETLTRIEARYALRASDGTVIEIVNPGVRVASPQVTAKLASGTPVDPSAYYFHTTPRFEVKAGAHDWLRNSVFVGRGVRRPDHVTIDVFQVR